MVEKAFQYRATPEDPITSKTAWQAVQTCREVYNHALTQEYRPAPDHDKPSYNTMQNKLPEWKREWTEWKGVYSKCLQMAVRRIKRSETVLDSLQERGFNVGRLNWKAPREYRSIRYNQSGFDVDSNTGRTGHAIVNLSKIGDFHLDYHRPLPNSADINEVILKKQKTGNWTVSIVVEYDANYPDKPTVEDIDVADTVGIDLGITKFIHDSDGRAFRPLDENTDRERIETRQGKNGCHVILVPPEGTTKRCVKCGVESDKPLWVRKHSCPSCGFETDRDQNAALEVQRLGLVELGVVEDVSGLGQELAESTPAETGTAAGLCHRDVVPASTVVDTGSPSLNERTAVAVSE